MTELQYNNALKLLFRPDTHETALMLFKNKISIKSILKKHELDKLGINTPAKLRKFVCVEYEPNAPDVYWELTLPKRFSYKRAYHILSNLKDFIAWRPYVTVWRKISNLVLHKKKKRDLEKALAEIQKALRQLEANPPKKVIFQKIYYTTEDLI
jgi:hypothetical protein